MADATPGKKGVIRRLFSYREWLNLDEVMYHSRNVRAAYKSIYTIPTAERKPETFEDAVQRLNLDETSVKQKQKMFLFYFACYLVFGLGLAGYGIYLVLAGSAFLAVVLSFVLAVLMFVYSIREHFWYMQISRRKLGCTWHDWFSFIFKRRAAQ